MISWLANYIYNNPETMAWCVTSRTTVFCGMWQGAPFNNIDYRKISNISRTKSPNSNVSRLGLQLSLRNILKPDVKWRMKM